MRWILDACTLIYLAKANLFDRFMQLSSMDVVIDSSVYEEAVRDGKDLHYPDAVLIEAALAKHNIAAISIDVKPHLEKFKDNGETSSYILASSDGVCVTTDKKARAKFKGFGVPALKLDQYFFQSFETGTVTASEFLDIVKRLESINAIDTKLVIFYQDLVQGMNTSSVKQSVGKHD
jgi:hypothetical protein